MYEYRRGGSVFGAFLLGGLLGAVLGLLFAPRSGKETRDMLTDRANEYWGQAGEFYETGKTRVTEVYGTGMQSASEKSEELRAKIDEARVRLQEQVSKSAEDAKGKLAETTPAVHNAVDRAAEATKSGVTVASGKAQDTLDFVAKKSAKPAGEAAPAEEAPAASPEVGPLPEA
jgi:gas vesicle protein